MTLTGLRRWLFVVSNVMAGLVIGVLLATVALAMIERDPALRVLEQADAGQVAANDGRLLIYTKINRVKSCRIETTHWLFTLVDHEGEQVRAYVPIAEDGPVPLRAIGLDAYVLSVPLPPGLWPGKWFWLESRAEFCGTLGWLFPIYSESEPLVLDIERARAIGGVPVTARDKGNVIVRSRSPVAPVVVPR